MSALSNPPQVVNEKEVIVKAKECDCNCAECQVCSKKDTHDILLTSMKSLMEDLSDMTKNILGFVFSMVATLTNLIILYLSFPSLKTWKTFSILNVVGSIFDFLPTEAIISLGFIMCCLSGYMHEYVEIGLTLMLAASSIYWAYSNGQVVALAASVVMLAYGVFRTGLLNFLPKYVVGLFQYTSFIVFTMLAISFAINISNNLNINEKSYE